MRDNKAEIVQLVFSALYGGWSTLRELRLPCGVKVERHVVAPSCKEDDVRRVAGEAAERIMLINLASTHHRFASKVTRYLK